MTGQAGIGLPITPEQRRIRELEEQVKQLTIEIISYQRLPPSLHRKHVK
jgi:hypothetical protein